MAVQLVDIGVNLWHPRFRNDRAEIIDRAEAAGVCPMIITGVTVSRSREALEMARSRPGKLYATAGVHPHDAKACDEHTTTELRTLAKNREVVAIGECGLDYDRDFSPRSVQLRWFEEQLTLACELQRPLFLHQREAHEPFVDILAKYRTQLPGGVIHCFTGNKKELEDYLDLDLFIGITGWICDERRGVDLQDVVRSCPLDRLMVETDAPFLTPRDLRPKPKKRRNEPAFLPHIVAAVGRFLGKTAEEVAETTTRNALNFFRIRIAERPIP